jgi:hypothetical protein
MWRTIEEFDIERQINFKFAGICLCMHTFKTLTCELLNSDIPAGGDRKQLGVPAGPAAFSYYERIRTAVASTSAPDQAHPRVAAP